MDELLKKLEEVRVGLRLTGDREEDTKDRVMLSPREQLSESAKLQMDKADEQLTDIAQKIRALEELEERAQDWVQEQLEQMVRFVHQEEDSVLSRLKDRGDDLLKRLRESQAQIARERAELERAARGLEVQDTAETLQSVRDVLESTESFISSAKAIQVEQLSGECLGPLQYKVWKKMKTVLQPGLASLKLDPNTAHPDLTLSSCLTSVQVGDSPQTIPDNQDRFSRYLAVVGAQGFTSGRHYWEVEVGEKTDWDLGVAGKSLDRKGRFVPSPKQALWVFALINGGQIWALGPLPTVLPLQQKPKRVGVYLDHQGGQVSFYDSEDMTHLFTFSDCFKETLYPYLSPCICFEGRNWDPLSVAPCL
ncbi:nuclear factor 7, ovary [Amia ocellicauda]|uniref:nuclear factor 7, ovary n=1 Tax=Amia ocellicauda TaxID=2972642 RepID=UPI003464A2B6